MFRLRLVIGLVLATLSSLACTKAEDPSLDEKMRHCPTAVEGALTEISDDEAGVRLVVTARTPAGASEIRRRVKHLEELTSGKETGVKHGGGKGGGVMRDCPVITQDTRVHGVDVEGGSTIVVQAIDPAKTGALRTETRARYERFLKR